MRRPGGVTLALALEELQKGFQGTRGRVDAGVTVAELLEPRRHRDEREVAGLAGLDLLPQERRRNARVRRRAHRVRGGDRAVLGVLVVVDEDAVALFLPPLARRQRRRPALDLARERERRAAHFVEAPAPLDAHADVHAAGPGGFGPPDEFQVMEYLANHRGGLP